MIIRLLVNMLICKLWQALHSHLWFSWHGWTSNSHKDIKRVSLILKDHVDFSNLGVANNYIILCLFAICSLLQSQPLWLGNMKVRCGQSQVIPICRYLQEEWNLKKQDVEGAREFSENTFPGFNPNCPQQNNSTDCGVFVLKYVESFFRVHFFLTWGQS